MSLPAKDGAKNLHSVWDSVIYLYTGTPALPFSSDDWDSLGADAQTMESKFSFNPSDWQNMDIAQWVNDSFELSKNNVYPDVTPGKALSAAYIEKNQQALEKQIVLGGLRLAFVI